MRGGFDAYCPLHHGVGRRASQEPKQRGSHQGGGATPPSSATPALVPGGLEVAPRGGHVCGGWSLGGLVRGNRAVLYSKLARPTPKQWLPPPCSGLSQPLANGERFLAPERGLCGGRESQLSVEDLQAPRAQFHQNTASPTQAVWAMVTEVHSSLFIKMTRAKAMCTGAKTSRP